MSRQRPCPLELLGTRGPFRGGRHQPAQRALLPLRDRGACGGLAPVGRVCTRTSPGVMEGPFCLCLLVLTTSAGGGIGGRGWQGCAATRAVLGQTRHAPQLARDMASGSTGHREKEGRGTSPTESPCAGRVCCLGVIRELGSAEGKQTTSGLWGRHREALEGNQRASSGDGWG